MRQDSSAVRPTKGFMGSTATALLSLPLLAVVVGAAEPSQSSPPFGERVEVEVVNVDVVVTESSGRRVTDLTKRDFALEVDGRPTLIEYFAAPASAVDGEALAPREEMAVAQTIPIPARSPDLANLFVFVDQSALAWKTSARILDEIRDFVRSRAGGTERIMIAAFVEDLRILSPPTADWARIELAFDELDSLRGRGSLVATERSRLEHDVRNYGRVRIGSQPRGTAPELVELRAQREGEVQEQELQQLEAAIQNYGERELDRQARAIAALRQWIGALAAIEGRKSVLFAASGYSSQPTAFLTQFLNQKLGKMVRPSNQASASLQATGVSLMVDFEGMVQAAQNARVAFYTVSPRQGPVEQASAEFETTSGKLSGAPPPTDLALTESASSLTRLAAATGGATLALDEDLSDRLDSVRADAAAVYSLGFATGDAAGSSDHAIVVRVNRPRLEVRHRETFRRQTLAERAEQALVAAVTLDTTANELGLVLELGTPEPLDKKGSERRVPILVRIPLGLLSLLPSGATREGRLFARVAIQNERRDVELGDSGAIRISVPEGDLSRALESFWAYRAEVLLSPGRHRFAVVVADEVAGVVSTAAQSIEIPKE